MTSVSVPRSDSEWSHGAWPQRERSKRSVRSSRTPRSPRSSRTSAPSASPTSTSPGPLESSANLDELLRDAVGALQSLGTHEGHRTFVETYALASLQAGTTTLTRCKKIMRDPSEQALAKLAAVRLIDFAMALEGDLMAKALVPELPFFEALAKRAAVKDKKKRRPKTMFGNDASDKEVLEVLRAALELVDKWGRRFEEAAPPAGSAEHEIAALRQRLVDNQVPLPQPVAYEHIDPGVNAAVPLTTIAAAADAPARTISDPFHVAIPCGSDPEGPQVSAKGPPRAPDLERVVRFSQSTQFGTPRVPAASMSPSNASHATSRRRRREQTDHTASSFEAWGANESAAWSDSGPAWPESPGVEVDAVDEAVASPTKAARVLPSWERGGGPLCSGPAPPSDHASGAACDDLRRQNDALRRQLKEQAAHAQELGRRLDRALAEARARGPPPSAGDAERADDRAVCWSLRECNARLRADLEQSRHELQRATGRAEAAEGRLAQKDELLSETKRRFYEVQGRAAELEQEAGLLRAELRGAPAPRGPPAGPPAQTAPKPSWLGSDEGRPSAKLQWHAHPARHELWCRTPRVTRPPGALAWRMPPAAHGASQQVDSCFRSLLAQPRGVLYEDESVAVQLCSCAAASDHSAIVFEVCVDSRAGRVAQDVSFDAVEQDQLHSRLSIEPCGAQAGQRAVFRGRLAVAGPFDSSLHAELSYRLPGDALGVRARLRLPLAVTGLMSPMHFGCRSALQAWSELSGSEVAVVCRVRASLPESGLVWSCLQMGGRLARLEGPPGGDGASGGCSRALFASSFRQRSGQADVLVLAELGDRRECRLAVRCSSQLLGRALAKVLLDVLSDDTEAVAHGAGRGAARQLADQPSDAGLDAGGPAGGAGGGTICWAARGTGRSSAPS